jgi:hypothetical protein
MGNSWRAPLLPYPGQYAHSEFAYDSRGLVPGRDGASVETYEDRYIVERVTKVKDDVGNSKRAFGTTRRISSPRFPYL